MIRLKRVYEKPSPDDGPRILVERLWPRGVKKAKAAIDFWIKEVAPSADLRKWFAHDPKKWEQFVRRYWKELQRNPAAIGELQQACGRGAATLVYAARDQEHNGAIVLWRFLKDRSRAKSARRMQDWGCESHYTAQRSLS
jgi:uncharacterized protein YeaO (DUF488 family)